MASRTRTDETQGTEHNELDDFLSHRGGGGGSFGGFLGNWKDDGQIEVWLHPRGYPKPLWSHRWFVIGKDKKTDEDKIRFIRFNSYENERVLKSRHARLRNGQREYPPEICPFSKTLEWVWQAIEAGTIGIADEIFRIEVDTAGDDEDSGIVLHAGGFCGMFGRRDLSEAQKKLIKRAGVRLTEAWKENCHASLQYVFRVIVHDEPEKGTCIALEKQSLGDKLKKVIQDRQDDVGKEMGDPFKHPYCFRWCFDDRKEFADKYDVKAITSRELNDDVRAAMEEEPPSIDNIMGLSNIAELRLSFEHHWCHDVVPPWDELFGPAEERFAEQAEAPTDFNYGANAGKGRGKAKPEEDDEDDDVEEEKPQRGNRGASSAQKKADEDDFPPSYNEPPKRAGKPATALPSKPEREEVLCEKCEKVMYADEFECPHCHVKYDEDGKVIEPPPEPETKPMRRRGGKK